MSVPVGYFFCKADGCSLFGSGLGPPESLRSPKDRMVLIKPQSDSRPTTPLYIIIDRADNYIVTQNGEQGRITLLQVFNKRQCELRLIHTAIYDNVCSGSCLNCMSGTACIGN